MLRNAFQLLGFGIGIALLIWCVRRVLSEENRAALERLRDASAWEILLLLSIAASSIILNGIIFWVIIRPLHKIRLSDMIATNGVATFLSYLPFKISVIARWIVHNRRDGVPSLTIGTWFLVVVGLTAVTITPLGLAFLRPAGAGWWWWLVILLGVAAAHWIAMIVARWVRGEAGLRRLQRLRVPTRVLEHDWFHRLHDGAAMAGDGHATWVAGAARLLDVGGFTVRIGIAAGILGVNLTVQDTVLIGLAYFVIGVVSPFGTVGTREAGALALAIGAGVVAAELQESALLTAILLVTVTDALTCFIGAGFGLAWLRADRLLTDRGVSEELAADLDSHPKNSDSDAAEDPESPTIPSENRSRTD
ncbi:MAG: hypothetical protein AB8F26_12790 [Phycisphaerales bacterium]